MMRKQPRLQANTTASSKPPKATERRYGLDAIVRDYLAYYPRERGNLSLLQDQLRRHDEPAAVLVDCESKGFVWQEWEAFAHDPDFSQVAAKIESLLALPADKIDPNFPPKPGKVLQ